MSRTVRLSHRLALLVSVLACLLGLAATPAWASRGAAVIRDCLAHDRITHAFTLQDYRDALRQLPADVSEYSDCGDVIRRAELASAGSGGRSSGSGPSGFPGGGGGANSGGNPLAGASPSEQAAVAAAAQAGQQPVRIDGRLVQPGVIRSSSIVNSLPTPVLAGIVALLLGALLGPAAGIRNLVRARRPR